ncbi:hypothetical protein V5799_026089 [Amblyomma americanum]|uniref:Peptidase M13 N-terminal domain-containing protein n=1 Tax=Amblyomma americanum TaxID=6943 RepID=A0AAQ4DJK5_AMBAM
MSLIIKVRALSQVNREGAPGTTHAKEEATREAELWSLVAIALAATAAVLVVFYVVQSTFKRQVCTTAACESFAKLLGESVNASANPCDSFGRYVCDGWRIGNVVSVQEVIYQTALEAIVKSIAKVAIPETSQNAGEQTAALFRSCYTSQDRLDAEESLLVREYLTQAGVTWPWVPAQPDVLETSMFLAFELGWPAVLDFKLERDSSSTTVVIDPARSLALVLRAELQVSSEEAWKRYFDALVLLFSIGDGSSTVTYSDVHDADLLMKKRLRDALVRNWTRLEMNNLYPGGEVWANALAKRNITGSLRLMSSSSSFVPEFVELWKEYGEAKMHLYVSWCAVRYVARFLNRQLLFTNVGHRHYSTSISSMTCLLFTYGMVGDAVFVPYSAQVLRSGVRSDVAKLVMAVRKAFTQRFLKDPLFSTDMAMITEWASVRDVFKAFDYRFEHDLRLSFRGYPDLTTSFVRNWRNLSRSRYLNDTEPVHHYAVDTIMKGDLYSILKSSKDFALLPFALTFPMYDADMSIALKYGTLGTLLARASAEIALNHYAAHASTAERVFAAEKCFAKDSRTMSIVPQEDVLLEAVALEAALDAFQEAAEDSRKGQDGLGGYSAIEAFFLSWCFTKCAAPATTRSADVDRCSAPLRHVQRFSDAFSCQPETSLNPVNKCRLF